MKHRYPQGTQYQRVFSSCLVGCFCSVMPVLCQSMLLLSLPCQQLVLPVEEDYPHRGDVLAQAGAGALAIGTHAQIGVMIRVGTEWTATCGAPHAQHQPAAVLLGLCHRGQPHAVFVCWCRRLHTGTGGACTYAAARCCAAFLHASSVSVLCMPSSTARYTPMYVACLVMNAALAAAVGDLL
jgi:hypothetical protein